MASERKSIENAGCRLLYLPPYSPDLNPIKRLLRSAEEWTVDGLWKAIGQMLDRFTTEECGGYVIHRGYHATVA